MGNAISLALSPVFIPVYAPFFETKKINVWTVYAVLVGLLGVWVMAPSGISGEALRELIRGTMSEGLSTLDKTGNAAAAIFRDVLVCVQFGLR